MRATLPFTLYLVFVPQVNLEFFYHSVIGPALPTLELTNGMRKCGNTSTSNALLLYVSLTSAVQTSVQFSAIDLNVQENAQ